METPTAESTNADGLSLRSFKTLLSDPSGALTSWDNASLHFCRWRGVTCRNHGGEPRVSDLKLESLQLEGELSPSLANLTFLRRLRLELHNNMNGTIPRNLSNCLELQFIGLDNSNLEGEIPDDIGSLPKLQALVIWSNQLTGSIPPEIVNLGSLTSLYMRFNHLNGPIPAAIGNLSSLTELDLSNNLLAGAIPAAIWNLTSLRGLLLWNNRLTGAIPSDIGNLVGLDRLLLSSNEFTGTIPPEIGKLEKVSAVFLQNNNLKNAAEWSFLDALTNCTRLRILDLSINHLSGELPKPVANLSKTLQWLKIHDNQIAGSIPTEIGNLSNLTVITMSPNLLDATIPAALGSLRRLIRIDLSENYLAGEIPATLGNLSQLTSLLLSSNELRGSIPPSLGKCPLDTLNLAFNKLSGGVPKEIFYILGLTKLFDISHNSLTGSLPPEIGNLRNIQIVDVSSNRLSGEIPGTIAQCEVLQYLHMQGNFFHGHIPSSFGQLKGLRVLDISSNDLWGRIPDFVGSSRSMTYLNLSYNNLDGEVPTDGIFGNVSAFSVLGNINLCGGVPQLGLPSCSSGKKTSSVKLIAIISVAGGICCVIFLISCFAARHYSVTARSKDQHRKVTFAELTKATDGFSPANLIGTGSFGSVSRGVVDWEDHKDVAVKVLNWQQRGASRSFVAECEALRNTRHRNLVNALTSCSGVDFGGNDFKALVFEFLPNGSLDEWLHPPERDEQDKKYGLIIVNIWNILFCVMQTFTIIKPYFLSLIVYEPSSNITEYPSSINCSTLNKLRDKVGTKKTLSSHRPVTLRGSVGYAAPESGMGNKVSTEGDAYSYGIHLLEMFTGKRPTDDGFKEGLNLGRYIEVALSKRAVDIIDPYLSLQGGEGEARHANPMANGLSTRAVECVASVLTVGVLRSKEAPKQRMHMEAVVRELHDIRDAFLGLL
ncbi:unnamed protein product, partial [Musa acuminata subsp. burmannicoides]